MDMQLNIKDGNLVTEQGNPLGQYRPVFSFGCEYRCAVALSHALYGVTRFVAMLDTDFDFAEKSEVCALASFSPSDMAFTLNTRTRRFADAISGHPSAVGYLQIDAIHEDGTNTRVLLDRVILQGIVADSSESFAVASVRGLEISERGTWVIDGVDTGQPARGLPGVSPSAKVSVDKDGNVILTVTDASGTTEQVISDSLIQRIESVESVVQSLDESKTDRTEHDELEARVEQAESGVSSLDASKADRASTLAGYGITDAYTKAETDAKVSSVYRYRGSVETYAELPAEGNVVGDVWNIASADAEHGIDAGDNVAWTGEEWDRLSGEVDLTPYALKADAATDHNHDGAYVKIKEMSGALAVIDVGLKSENDIVARIFNASGNILAKGFRESGKLLVDKYAAKSHTHEIADVSGLQDALDSKSNADHDHEGVYLPITGGTVTGEFGTETSGIKEAGTYLSDKYSAKTHTHAISEVDGLQEAIGSGGGVSAAKAAIMAMIFG